MSLNGRRSSLKRSAVESRPSASDRHRVRRQRQLRAVLGGDAQFEASAFIRSRAHASAAADRGRARPSAAARAAASGRARAQRVHRVSPHRCRRRCPWRRARHGARGSPVSWRLPPDVLVVGSDAVAHRASRRRSALMLWRRGRPPGRALRSGRADQHRAATARCRWIGLARRAAAPTQARRNCRSDAANLPPASSQSTRSTCAFDSPRAAGCGAIEQRRDVRRTLAQASSHRERSHCACGARSRSDQSRRLRTKRLQVIRIGDRRLRAGSRKRAKRRTRCAGRAYRGGQLGSEVAEEQERRRRGELLAHEQQRHATATAARQATACAQRVGIGEHRQALAEARGCRPGRGSAGSRRSAWAAAGRSARRAARRRGTPRARPGRRSPRRGSARGVAAAASA